ncbi:hypothetical protein [Streptomyces sp. enrichment culture]|uniref:hypothetical protein n=1 Tax=Streptomyces sp. enrichment culture TaxID=1795815 RepID=UPI003F578796
MSRSTPARRALLRWGAPLAALVLVAGGVVLGKTTNAFGPGRVCRGWVSAADAQRALGGTGPVIGTDSVHDSCEVRLGGWGSGAGTTLILMPVDESSRFPFDRGVWRVSGYEAPLTGSRTAGAVDAYGGWVLLPDSCREAVPRTDEDERPVLRASVLHGEGDGDPAGMARVLESAARGLVERHGCAEPDAVAVGEPGGVSPAAATDFGAVCGLDGFVLPRPHGGTVVERVSGSRGGDGEGDGDGWFCDLAFSEKPRKGPFARFAIVRHPALTAALKDTDYTRGRCGGREGYFVWDGNDYWTPAQRADAGFPAPKDLSRAFDTAARKALGCG